MKTNAPANESAEMAIEERYCGSKMEMPIQQMFDEFIVFISKVDFE